MKEMLLKLFLFLARLADVLHDTFVRHRQMQKKDVHSDDTAEI